VVVISYHYEEKKNIAPLNIFHPNGNAFQVLDKKCNRFKAFSKNIYRISLHSFNHSPARSNFRNLFKDMSIYLNTSVKEVL